MSWVSDIINRTWFPRIFPFLLFVSFIALESLVDTLSTYYPRLSTLAEYDSYFFYPVKTILVAVVLFLLWSRYTEIDIKERISWKNLSIGLLAGVIVFFLWVNMDWRFATLSKPKEFNPFLFNNPFLFYLIISFRLFGASVVVPVFEEIFWRSFVIRYIVSPRFEDVPIGKFTWLSFIISSILFGLEHNLWLAGIMAGISYNLILYYTRSLAITIFSHGITNLLLGMYVLSTGNWRFW